MLQTAMVRCYGLQCVPQNVEVLIPNALDVTVSENSVYKGLLGWALIQCDWYLYKRLGHKHTQKEDPMKTQEEGGHLQRK